MSRAELKGNAHGISGQANMIGTTRASLSLSSQRKEDSFLVKEQMPRMKEPKAHGVAVGFEGRKRGSNQSKRAYLKLPG